MIGNKSIVDLPFVTCIMTSSSLTEMVTDSLARFSRLLEECPLLCRPYKNNDEKMKVFFSVNHQPTDDASDFLERNVQFRRYGLCLIPTVERTSIIYDQVHDMFIKVLHPGNLKSRLFSVITNKAKTVYHISERFLARDIPVPKVLAYGSLKWGNTPVYVMERLKGRSLHKQYIAEKNSPSLSVCMKTMDRVAEVHGAGYWFRDLRAAHIFFNGDEFSGFVDIDGIRRNMPFRWRNIAKDLAGLDHPDLLLDHDERLYLFHYYTKVIGCGKERELLRRVKYYSDRRWKGR